MDPCKGYRLTADMQYPELPFTFLVLRITPLCHYSRLPLLLCLYCRKAFDKNCTLRFIRYVLSEHWVHDVIIRYYMYLLECISRSLFREKGTTLIYTGHLGH